MQCIPPDARYTYGVVAFASDSTFVAGREGTTVRLVVERTGPTTQPATVSVIAESLDGSVVIGGGGADASLVSSVAVFAANVQSVQVEVVLRADGQLEGAEEFTVRLAPASGAEVGPQNVATVTILPSDGASGDFGFAPSSMQVTAIERDAGESTLVALVVMRTIGLTDVASVAWMASHEDGSNVLITPTSGELIFAVGVSQVIINISIPGDLLPEVRERIYVTLSDASLGSLVVAARGQSVITVPENDGFYVVPTGGVASVMIGEDGSRKLSVDIMQVCCLLCTVFVLCFCVLVCVCVCVCVCSRTSRRYMSSADTM